MTYLKNERTGRICAGVLLALAAVFVVLVAYQIQHRDADIFWALRAGRWIADHLRVPATDPFSYTFAGAPWIDFTWGFQVIAHVFYTFLGGWTGLFILQVAVTGAAFCALYLSLKARSGGRVWLASTGVILVFAGSYSRLFIRPHLFGFLFITLYLLFLDLHERKGRVVFLLALPPLQVLWINIHSSAVLGVFILWAYASGEIIDGVRKEGFHYLLQLPPAAKRLLAVSVILPLASLVNPYGLRLALFPFIHQAGGNADALHHIGEWLRLPIRQLFFSFYPYPLNQFAFRVLFYSAVISFIFNFRRVRARDLMIFAAAAYMAATHIRWMGQFGFFVAPLIASNLSGCMGEAGPVERRLRWITLAAGGLIAILMIRVLALGPFIGNYGLGVKGLNYPVGTVEFMKREKIGGHIYNDYIFGGYLIFADPSVKVFIDGRTPTVYSPYFFWTTRLAGRLDGWRRLVKEHGITAALVKIDKKMCGNLYEDPAWTPVVFDDVSVLFLKEVPRNRGTLKRWGMDVNPCADKERYELPDDVERLERMRRALERALPAIEPGGAAAFSRPHRLLGLIGTKIGTKEALLTAAGELRKALGVNDDSYTNYDLAVALRKLDRKDEAALYFRRSVNKDRGFKKAGLALGLTLFDLKDYRGAVRELERYISMADDRAEFAAYKDLGIAYFNLSNFAPADRALKRAAFLAGDKSETAEVYYYLGNTLFEEGRYAAGALYYRLALANRPAYAGVLKELARKLRDQGKEDAARRLRNLLMGSGGPEKGRSPAGRENVQKSQKLSF